MALTVKWTVFNNLDVGQVRAFVGGRLPGWISLALVVIIAWQLARLTWILIPGASTDDPINIPAQQPAANSSIPTTNQPSVNIIASSHLFGEANIDEFMPLPTPSSDVDSLPEARAGLILKGTVTGSNAQPSFAIIANSSKEEKVYKTGDPVLPGTTLHEIYKDLVVLSQNGALSRLELPKDFPKGTTITRRRPTSNRAVSSNRRSIQNVLAQNVSKLADVIRPTPYFVGGQQQGYRVYPGRNRKQFAALGLRPGDLIKDIDGASLTDPKQAMMIFQNLGNSDQVSVTVERNGQPQVLILKTSQLQLETNE